MFILFININNYCVLAERIGNLVFVQNDAATSAAVLSQLTLLVRANYSTPPAFGCRVVTTILCDPILRAEWMECIQIMSSRIRKMRTALYDELIKLNTPGTWNHITNQIGMFSYTGLTSKYTNLFFFCSFIFRYYLIVLLFFRRYSCTS